MNSTLRKVLILMGSVSAAIIVLALAAAFFPMYIIAQSRKVQDRLKRKTRNVSNTPHEGQHGGTQTDSEEDSMDLQTADEAGEAAEPETVNSSHWLWHGWSSAAHRPQTATDTILP